MVTSSRERVMLVHDLVYRMARPQWAEAEADARIAELTAELAGLEAEIARLKSELAELNRRLELGSFW